jgi:hypothetical protein
VGLAKTLQQVLDAVQIQTGTEQKASSQGVSTGSHVATEVQDAALSVNAMDLQSQNSKPKQRSLIYKAQEAEETRIDMAPESENPTPSRTVAQNLNLTHLDERKSGTGGLTTETFQSYAKATPKGAISCLSKCSCSCHIPLMLNILLRRRCPLDSRILVIASNLPRSTSILQPCDSFRCKRTYDWLVRLHLRLRFFLFYVDISAILCKTSIQLMVAPHHIIEWDSPIFEAARRGDVATVKYLFDTGQASINDVDTRGQGLLHMTDYTGCGTVAQIRQGLEMARFLVSQGVKSHSEIASLDICERFF